MILDVCTYVLVALLAVPITLAFSSRVSPENLLNVSKSQNLNNETTRSIAASSQPEEPDEITHPLFIDERHERTGSVKFADQSDEGKEVKGRRCCSSESQSVDWILQSSLQRHNTPHPKDLRTWRNKAAKKFQTTDGNLLHHDHRHPFQPNAHNPPARDLSQPSLSSGQSASSNISANRTVPGMMDSIAQKQKSRLADSQIRRMRHTNDSTVHHRIHLWTLIMSST